MKKTKYCLTVLLLFPMFITNAEAIPYRDQILHDFKGDGRLEYKGSADAIQYKSIVLGTSSNPIRICNDPSVTYNLKWIRMQPLIPPSNETFSSGPSFSTLNLFDSRVPAYKIVPWYTTNELNGADMNQTGMSQRSIPTTYAHAWGNGTFLMYNDQRTMKHNTATTGGVRVDHGYYIYKGAERVPAGEYQIAPEGGLYLMRYDCFDDNSVIREQVFVKMAKLTAIHYVSTCVPDKQSDVIKMGAISISVLEAAKTNGVTAGSVTHSFSLKCDPNVSVNLSVVDLLRKGNELTKISSLTSDSTAKGVGYTVSYNSKVLKFGPDISSAFLPGEESTVDRVFIKKTDNFGANIPVSYSLKFSYAPTGETISKGTANSLIGITYSYQ